MKIKQISPLEHNFTKKLEGIALMPKMLYYYGTLPLDNLSLSENKKTAIKSVAIVGARKNTSYGEDVAYRAAYELAKRGAIIVSGLAYGIDSIAHRGALAAGGVTIGVLGTPIDKIYPERHIGLAEEMINRGGAVISEYAPGVKLNYKRSFLERNRLISGLSDAVIVVEANVRSGSLNTATHALEQGRELFAVPGDINRPLSQGCNRLISQGANPYTCVEDVLNYLFPEAEKKKNRKQPVLFGDNQDETALLQVLAKGVSSGEEIIAETGMEVAKYNQIVTMLEIKGRIRSLGMNRWTLT